MNSTVVPRHLLTHVAICCLGFFIVCYLVEREGYRLQDAIQEFYEKRPPGIKHDHFVNELYVRYAVKMERRGTVVGD